MAFDAHAHAGEFTEDAFVASASTDEYETLRPFPHRALGSIAEGGMQPDLCMLRKAAAEGFHIGEIGLDKRYGSMEEQKKIFSAALSIAREYGRAAVIHIVKEYHAAAEILRASGHRKILIHGFTGSAEIARELISLGAVISLSPRAERTKSFRSLLALPFVTETDMMTGEEQRRTLSEWNARLSEMTGIDVEKRTVMIMQELLG